MTWLTWRLHRAEAMIGIPLFIALLAIMVLATGGIDAAYSAARDGDCFDNGLDPLCSEVLSDYSLKLSNWGNLTTLLHGVPLAAAALIAMPTLQELERGTHRLSWTQSISRRRWALVRIGFAVGIMTLVTAVWAVVAADWRESLFPIENHTFARDAFELSPPVLLGYGLFALALGLTGTVVIRRLIPTLGLLAVGFISTRIFTTFYLRERFRPPIQETNPAANDPGAFFAFADRWMLDESWLSRTGERLSWEYINRLCTPLTEEQNTETFYRQCQIDNGLQFFRSYHPTSRVGQFQLIETALYLGLAAALLAFTYWWLTRRPA
jgi:hypothetical protein